jgi:serine/threonine-protein kinase
VRHTREARGEVREGEIVEGKYRIGRLLGSGAMGTVFAADHILLDQKVAIKFLVPESLGHSDSIARFLREARATATIKSKHVVRVLDVALRDGGAPYIVMEDLEGGDVAAWLRSHGPPEFPVAVDFILQACDGIAEAHELGIIHRDVKPSNLFAVQRRGVVESIKVLDFGIAKAPGLVSSTAPPGEWHPGAIITEERIPIGSPCYMSPEQMESARDVDHRTDIWALGVTLCELVTGHLPFEGQSLVQVYALIKSGAPIYLREDLPPHLATAIRKCLEPERDRRYRSVRELEAALAPFGLHATANPAVSTQRSARAFEAGGAVSPYRATPSAVTVEIRGAHPARLPADSVTSPKRQGPRVATMAAIGVAVLIAVVGVLGLVPKGQNPSATPTGSHSPSGPLPAALLSATAPAWSVASTDVPPPVESDPPLTSPKARAAEPNQKPLPRTPSASPPVALLAHLTADSAPPVPALSSTAAPTTSSSSDEWFPPPVPK